MDIKLKDGYGIASDVYGCSVYRTQTVKSGKSKGKEHTRFLGHFRRPQDAFEDLLDHKIRASDAKEIKELLEVIAEAKAMIAESMKNV